MVAVELAIPQAAILSVSKLMGSEGLGVGAGGGVGVSVANVDETQLGCNSIESRPSVDVDACSRTGILKNHNNSLFMLHFCFSLFYFISWKFLNFFTFTLNFIFIYMKIIFLFFLVPFS